VEEEEEEEELTFEFRSSTTLWRRILSKLEAVLKEVIDVADLRE
jgi:hypothetical protein